jgi:hypothetical protein
MTDAETCNPPDPICLSETHLARRWNKSTRTLQRWRAQGYGPAHIRLRGGVRYFLADVLAFEARLRRGGSDLEDDRDDDGMPVDADDHACGDDCQSGGEAA